MPSKTKYQLSASTAAAGAILPFLTLIAAPAQAQLVPPLTVTLPDGTTTTTTTVTGPPNADVVINTLGAGVLSTGPNPGLIVTSDGDITAQVNAIETTGDSATGALLRAADEVIFNADGTISTAGADADAVNIEGRTVTADLSNVSTTGPNAQGVEVGSLNGPTVVTADVINTSGDGSTGAIIRGTGDTTLSGNAIRTGGTDAAAFDISNDAAACLVLGAGGCDNTVTLDEVTTDGFGSTGGLVSSTGDTNVNVGVLRTGGDEAAGLSLSSDPSSCAVIGTGACDTAFTVNELTTAGERSPGAVVRGAGDISADVGVLRTGGDEAAGLDLASDPTACAILGAGGCDTSFSAGELTTTGDGSTGALIRSAGDTNGSVGVLSTQGNDAAGIDIASDPTACVIAGVGACDVGLAADSVTTSGDGAAGVLIDNAGATTGDFGLIRTGGDNSTGLGITQDPTACIAVGPGACSVDAAADDTQTGGANSPGIDIASPGPIGLDAGSVVTAGPVSDAIRIAGGEGAVSVIADNVTTGGADSDGIDVQSTTGAQTINAGRVNVAGVGADAIVAAAVCADIGITARDDVVSAQGSAIVADTGCAVNVSTLPGASVTGAVAGIDVSSGTGTTITVGDLVTAGAGPAINADGGAAVVAITPTGTVAGAVDLTAAADTLTNDGVFAPTGTSDFGAGVDLLTNRGSLRARGAVRLAGLETLASSGTVDLVDGAADDTLTVDGNFTGQAGSELAIDVAGTVTDRLIVGGTAGGTTEVSLNLVGGAPLVNPTGTVIVDAGTTATGAFTLPGGRVSAGFVDFTLGSNAAGDTLLLALPNQRAVEPLLLPQLGQTFWYQSADAFSAAAALRRDDLAAAGRRTGFWVQGYGSTEERGEERSIDVFGSAADVDLRYDTFRTGAQGGFDFQGGLGSFGITGGYQRAETDLASGTGVELEGYNVGAYFLYGGPRGFYAEALAKVDFFDGEIDFAGGDFDGKSYGAELELGWRGAMGSVNWDLGAGLAYVRTDLDGFEAEGGAFDFENAESLRGRVGLRVTGTAGGARPYADVKLLHEFAGDNEGSFTSGGFTLPLEDRGTGTWVRGEVGLTALPGVAGGYLAAWGEFGDVEGYGLRVGLRF